MAFFVPPYSSYTSVDTPVRGSVAAAIDVSWQQELQRHWEPLRQVKIPGIWDVSNIQWDCAGSGTLYSYQLFYKFALLQLCDGNQRRESCNQRVAFSFKAVCCTVHELLGFNLIYLA